MGNLWDSILDGLGWLLAQFYAVIPNAGVAIILLTVLIRLVLFPLTAKQAKSMIEMQRVQPEIKKLQAKYKNDRQKLNEELMKFYKEHSINPLGGCLPLLAQMPVFIALFSLLRSVPQHLPSDSAFYKDVCGSQTVNACVKSGYSLDFFGMDLARSASDSHDGIGSALPYFVLIAFVVITAFIQQRQTVKYSQNQPNQQMQMVGKVMPVVFAFISIGLPAGVVLYYFVSNVWQLGQQEFVYRRILKVPPKTGGSGTIDAASRDRGGGGSSGTSEPSSRSGGLLGRLLPAAAGESKDTTAETEPPSDNGKPSSKARKSTTGNGKPASGSAGQNTKAKSGGSGAKPNQSSTPKQGAGQQPRRRNNRKRKR